MGLVEELLERASVREVSLLLLELLLGYVVYKVFVVAWQNFRLARRGPRASRVPSSMPLGEDLPVPDPPIGFEAH